MRHSVVFVASLLFISMLISTLPARAQARRFKLPAVLQEVSGLVIAAPDSLWWHNDGGDEARLIRTDGQGRIQQTRVLPGARNTDWEDLTADPQGRLYIGDFGDNFFRRNDLRIYRYHPATGQLDSILFGYPQGKHYNVEAFFWHRDSLHLFTKGDLPRDFITHHFVLPDRPGYHQAQWRDSLQLPRRVVTAAAISADGSQIALLSYYYNRLLGFIPRSMASVFVLDHFPEGHYLRGRLRHRRISRLIATQYESLDYLPRSHALLVASEKTLFIKPRAKRVRAH